MSIVHVDDSNFDSEVLSCSTPVIVDFWAEWCGPCRSLGPIFEEVSNNFEGRVKFVKVNVDQANQVAQDYGVRGIPFLVMIKNGQVVNTQMGLVNKDVLTDFVEDSLD